MSQAQAKTEPSVSQEQYKAKCYERWQQLREETARKYGAFKAKRMTRRQLEAWIGEHSEAHQMSLRAILNQLRGR